ncbi:cytochrome P450 [Roridomyces roridus]|uniref:Cytochrome P450 n=1 Tax=Roridomyces roridus TaxID=1738132 RepID=A0AAD7BC01_9AGAR|nr:cytochrome P450 [Roridomyces roridus]
MVPSFSASLAGSLALYLGYQLCKAVYNEWVSPMRLLPGPKSTHWFFGNLLDIMKDESGGLQERILAEYGRTMKFHGFFGRSRLFTTDPKAVHHFMARLDIYQKSEASRFSLGRIVGPGILVVEDDEHKKQRKIMNPAFGAPQVRQLTSIFVGVSLQLRDIWAAQVSASGGVARIEVLSWFNKASLDMIGLAGFNYPINALGTESHETPNELVEAFENLVQSETSGGFSFLRFLQFRFPLFRRIPTKRDTVHIKSQATMKRIGAQLLDESKRQIAENGTFEEGTSGRDLFSLLVRANTAKDVSAKQRLSNDDVLAQVPTFLVAGHETTSTALTYALYALTQNPAAQSRLREELLGVSTDTPTLDELNSLEYLECVVRETLRVHAPVTYTSRVAMQDDIVPLAQPFTDIHGVKHNTLRIRKGDPVVLPILAMNRSAEIWGPDAMEFKPERWLSLDTHTAHPGIYAHLLTFIGGPRACIGYRFSLAETKAVLFTLIRAFEFELGVPKEDIGVKSTPIVQRPVVLSEREKGNQMPLLVRPVMK